MKKIRIAQIGINQYSHGKEIFETLCKFPDIFEIAGYCLVEDEEITCANKLYVFDSYPRLTLDQILQDDTIEAVTVETDEIHLTKYSTLAAKAGKHIHMEKPGGREGDEFANLVSIMKESQKVFHLGYMYRYNPFVIDALNAIKNGQIGDVLYIEAQMNCLHGATLRQWLGNFEGGMMFFLGCHLVDLVVQIQGVPKKIVPYNKSSNVDGLTTCDFSMATLEYDNGVSFVKSTACEVGGYSRRQFVVCGTKGTIELKPFEMIDRTQPHYAIYTDRVIRRLEDNDWYGIGTSSTTGAFDRYEAMILAFADYVLGKSVNPYTYDYELLVHKTLLECCK